MTTQNYFYQAAIDVLMDEDIDYKSLVVELVKQDPAMFLLVHQSACNNMPWMKEVDNLLRGEKKISAIKVWRAHTGDGLKDSRDAVEARAEKMGINLGGWTG